MSANALIQQAFYAMQIISPAIAGLLVSTLGPASCFALDTASFVFSAVMVSTLTIPHVPAAALKSLRDVVLETRVGVKFIFTHSAISFVVISMTAGIFAIRCFGALIAVYVRDVLRSGSSLFGLLGSLVGVGMIAGTQLVRLGARNRSNSQIVMLGLVGTGCSIALLAAIGTRITAVSGMLGVGFFVAFIIVPAQVLLQEHTPENMLGRVSGSMMAVMSSSQVIALLSAGELANRVGIRNVYYGSALLLFAVAAAGYYRLSREAAPQESAAVA
jgi:DHA3 family macrolide efflux protein-like MFS transporter